MKALTLFLLVAAAAAAPSPQDAEPAQIVRDEREFNGDGTFSYAWEDDAGTMADATGENKAIGEAFGVAMRGSYEYTAPDGRLIKVEWTADENGFQPKINPAEK